MHTLQIETINKYRKVFKDEPLRLTAKKTQLQLTRVFRIFNGYEMKLSEYLAFQRAIANHHNSKSAIECPYTNDFQYLTHNFFQLDEKTARDIRRKVEFTLELKKLSQTSAIASEKTGVMQ